jgi:NifU-like protein
VTTQPVLDRLSHLRFQGTLSEADAIREGRTLITTAHGAQQAPEHINLWLLADATGVVRAVRYATNAQGELLAVYDVMAELCLDAALSYIATVTPRMVEARLRGALSEPVLVLGADADIPFYVLTKAVERATGKVTESTPPPASPASTDGSQLLPWTDIGLFEKVRRIEGVLDAHVRPALASDGGGMDLVDLKADELFVQYHGACGSCSSSIGGTLQFVQDSLNNHLGTALQVKVAGVEAPDFVN